MSLRTVVRRLPAAIVALSACLVALGCAKAPAQPSYQSSPPNPVTGLGGGGNPSSIAGAPSGTAAGAPASTAAGAPVASGGSGGMSTAGIAPRPPVTAGGGAGAGVIAGTGGTGGSTPQGLPGEAPPTMAPTFKAVFGEIIGNNSVGNCTFGPCHGAPPSPENGNLQLLRADPMATYTALVGMKSKSGICGDMPLVMPGQPEASLLLLKLKPNPPCGIRMPIEPAAKPLSDAQLQQVEAWIKAGAMNN